MPLFQPFQLSDAHPACSYAHSDARREQQFVFGSCRSLLHRLRAD
jgi:hypothetical protein